MVSRTAAAQAYSCNVVSTYIVLVGMTREERYNPDETRRYDVAL